MHKKSFASFLAIALAVATSAAASPSFSSTANLDTWVSGFTTTLKNFVNAVAPALVVLAFIVFVWGLITFILASGDEAAKAEGKRRMVWGVIALFVIVSIWGIIAWLQTLLGVSGTSTGSLPTWSA